MVALFENRAPIKRETGLIGALEALVGCIREGRWVCLRPHLLATAGFATILEPRECKGFRDWLLCQVWCHATPTVRDWLITTGFIDSLTDGGTAFWRWDFWNAIQAAAIRRIEAGGKL